MKFSFLVPALALSLLSAGHALAEQADRLKPMQVEADKMQHDEGRQLTVLTGNVQAVKGTLVMRAARMEVQQDDKGQQLARFWAEPGERVFFRQKREGVDEFIEGEALEAEYDSQLDRMVLTGRAEVRILREGRQADQILGQRIVYNNSTEVLNIDGKSPGAAAVDTSRSRVRAVLSPKPASSAPAASAPPLRPIPSMGSGERRP